MKKLLKTFLLAVCLLVGGNAWAGAPVSGSDYLIKNVQTGYYLVGGIDYGTHACLHKMPQWFTFTGSDNVYTLDSHQFNSSTNHFLATGLYVDGESTNWTVTETATPGVFTISNGGNYIAGNGVDAVITTTTDGTSAAAQWQLISYSDFVSTLEGEIGVSGVDATPYIKDPELKRNGNFITYSGTKPWSITGYDGTGTPKNYSEGQNGNNASCAESYQSSNGFKFAQTLTGMKPGQYKLTAQAFYRQDGTDTNNYPYLFVGDAKSNFPERSGTENNMVEAYASFLSGTYPVDPITFVVSSESDNVTIGYANANVKMWNIFGQTQLTYYGTALINDAKIFNNGGTMAAGQWYYFDATVAGTYEFSAGSDLTAISYTTDGTQLTSSATGTTLTASQALSATRYYFKSSSAQTLTVAVPTGAQIVNADIDFTNAISDGAVAGNLNSMVLSITDGTYKYELGYTSGTPATTVLGDVLRVGNGTGRVTIPDAQLAGNRDEVIISFDMWFGNLNGKNAGFYLYDNAKTPAVIGALYCSKYDNTEVINSFGIDRSKITAVGRSGVDNASICVNSNKTTFNIHLNYSTNTMYVEQYTNGTLQQTTTPVSLGSSNPLKTFEVGSNYSSNPERRCWFDNLHIYTIRGDYSVVPVGYTVKFQDTEGNTIKADDTSRSAIAGTAISTLATTADKTTFYNDGVIANNNTVEFAGATNKYVFKSVSAVTSSSDDTPVDEVAAAGHVVTIVYDKYIKYDYTIKQKLGTADATSLQSNSLWQDQTLTYYYPVCVKSGDDYYVTEKKNTTPYFGVVVTKDNTNHVINYTEDSRIVYYVESDDMAGSRYSASQAASYSSGGKSWCSGASTNSYLATSWTLGAGSYDIEVGMANRDFAVTPAPQLKSSTDDDTPVNLEAISLAKSSYAVKNYTSQAIAADEQLYFYNDNNPYASKWALDYVIVRSLPATQSVTVTSAGYATYVPSYDLNFSDTDIKAYKVKVNTKGVATMNLVNNVPAGTPVLLYYEGGKTEDIPVMTGAAAVTENDLVAGNATTAKDGVTTIDGDYTNMILNNIDSKIGFYFANGKKVATNRAYLHIASTLAPDAAASRMVMVFADDETTGVQNLTPALSEGEGVVYNLRGQRVAQPTKGLYIVNGKKVVIK